MTLGNNVKINGTLVVGSDINITGSNVVFNSVSLLPMSGSTTPIRLPVAVTKNNFYCSSTGQATVNGVIVANKQFWIDSGSQTNIVSVVGRVICSPFVINAANAMDPDGNDVDEPIQRMERDQKSVPVFSRVPVVF